MPNYIYCISYLIIINLISSIVTISDKLRAESHRWRVPEHTLLFFAVIGGSPAMLFTMLAVHHKTRRLKFMLGIPVIIIFQITLCLILKYL